MNKTILIADDHPLFREALTNIVQSVLPNCEIIEAINYAQAMEQLQKQNFTMAFLDLNMPDSNGLTDLALIKKSYPKIPMVIVSAHEDIEIVRACINLNTSGYIIKSSSPNEIKSAIKTIIDGDIYIPPSIDITSSEHDNLITVANTQLASLTPSQLKVLIEIGKGKLNKQIAYDLDISEATVKAHITTIFKKLSINNRTQAVLFIKEQQVPNSTIS